MFEPRKFGASGAGDTLASIPPPDAIHTRVEALIQLLAAYRDLADFDDIHQADQRLREIQAWIKRETRAAAADPLFDDSAAPPRLDHRVFL
jgi:hypothetical protein